MLLAYTRAVSPTLRDCELTHLARLPIDLARAVAEHEAYEDCLRRSGVAVRRLLPEPDLPDAVFVEDTAVVFDDVAVIARPGAESRRDEVFTVAETLAAHRPLAWIEAPATLDGGDVLVVGDRVFVGVSSRTNREAVNQLAGILHPLGRRVIPVQFEGCLHLKSAVTRVADDLLLLNPAWLERSVFAGLRTVDVDPAEPHAANALALPGAVIFPAHHPRTGARLVAQGLHVVPVVMQELAKAEAGVTCCSLLVSIGRK